MAGFESPTFHPVVRAALEAGKRAVGKPVSPKEPLTSDLIQSLAEFYNRPEAKLDQIRFLFTVLVSYAGFMRMDEILSVREDSQIDFTTHNVKWTLWGWGVLKVDVIKRS